MKAFIGHKILVFCFLLLFSQVASAVVFEVTTEEELQAALTAAASNGGDDEILLASETFRGSFYYFAEEAFDLDITSKDIDSPAIIDADGKNFGLFVRGNDKSFNLSIRYLVIQNADNPADGGGLHLRQIKGEALLDSVRIVDNTSSGSGGGIFSFEVQGLKVLNSAIVRNTAESGAAISHGGGLNSSSIAVTIESTKFEENFATDVRVLDISAESVNFLQVVFAGNTTYQNYHPCIEIGATDLLISESTFERNSCGRGVFYLSGNNSLNLTKSTLRGNSNSYPASKKRLAYLSSAGRLNVAKNFIKGSSEPIQLYPGYSETQEMELAFHGNLLIGPNVEFIGNGSPIVNIQMTQNTLVNFSNTNILDVGVNAEVIVQNNIFKTENSEVDLELESLATLSVLRNNIIEEYSGFWITEQENLSRDPMFYDEEAGDYHLVSNSPAVDAGSNEFVGSEEYDLDGNARIINGVVDIGAYERSTAALHPADTNGDQSISQVEFDSYNSAWRTNEAWPAAPAVIPVDFVTRAGFLLQKGGIIKILVLVSRLLGFP